jgi:excisionase family DNA binding protein
LQFEPLLRERMLTAGEVAAAFGVEPKTVVRWADAGKLPCIKTLGGHRRFPASAVAEYFDKPV